MAADSNNMIPPEAAPAFLETYGWGGAEILPLAGDASFRRYFRVQDKDRHAVLMDAPPPHEDPKPFARMADYLTQHGFRAPTIFARDLEKGLLLLEDLGDARMREHLDEKPEDERTIYTKALDELLLLAQKPVADVPDYDAPTYLRETGLVTEWFVPAAGLDVDAEAYNRIWMDLLAPIIAAQNERPVTVMRDYHAENIMLLEGGALGHLDFQDALKGHSAYDLVSLLQDARRDVSPELEADMLRYYISNSNQSDDFAAHYAVLGAQRNAKIVGIFTRLWKRDGKPRYMEYMPRMWGLLDRDLAHPALAPMQQWFDEFIPQEARTADLAQAAG